MNYYQFHINDFHAATRHLTHLERAFYRELIDMYYDTEAPITADLAVLHRRLRIITDDEKQALANVLDEFFTLKHGKYRHARIDREIKNYQWAHRNDSNDSNDRNDSNEKSNESNDHSNGKSNENRNGKAMSNACRQARFRQRKKMVQSLIAKGFAIPIKATFEAILSLFNRMNGNDSNEKRNEKIIKSNGKNNAITNNHKIYNLASCAKTQNFQKTTPQNPKTPTTAEPRFEFSQSQRDRCAKKSMNIDETFTKFANFYTAKGFVCTQSSWIAMFDNWIDQERLPTVKATPSTGSTTPTGENYTDYIKRLNRENDEFNRAHNLSSKRLSA